jgi:hypothetical protein
VHTHKVGHVCVNQENGIRPRSISSGRRLLLAFPRCTGLLDPCRPSVVDEGLPFIAHVLLITISIAITHALGHAQAPVASQEAVLSSSTAAHDGSVDTPSTSIQLGPLNPVSISPCRLGVPDTLPQSSANATENTTTLGSWGYTPLSACCKFQLFVKQTYSPYTFASAGFPATWAQAMGQWPH